jgi:hypothetical protein
MNSGELAPLKLLIRGTRVPALGAPDLSAQLYGVLCAYDERWAGARPTSIDQAAYAPPDVPLRELGGIRPPVRDILGRGPRCLRRLFSLQYTLPANLADSEVKYRADQYRAEQIYPVINSGLW